MLIEGVDYIIRSAGGLTAKVKGFVCEDADGFYNIYVNKNCSYEQQETIRHELKHIILLCSFQLAKKIDTLSTIQYNKRRAIRELIRHTPELTIAPMLIA